MYGHYVSPGYVRQPTLDGYGEQWAPANIVYNGLGEPVGAFPALAALLPLAAKAVGALAPMAAKAAGAIMPIASKAMGSLIPSITSALPSLAQQAIPGIMQALPGLLPGGGGGGGLPFPFPPMPGFAPAAAPVATPYVSPAMMPAQFAPTPTLPAGRRSRRRRRRSFVRVLRDRNTGEVKAVRPIVKMSVPAPLAPMPSPAVAPAQVATDSSGGVSGYGFYAAPFGGLHACGKCGGVHGYGHCPF